MVGIEPTLEVIQKVFETFASANSATSPWYRMQVNRERKRILAVERKPRQIDSEWRLPVRLPNQLQFFDLPMTETAARDETRFMWLGRLCEQFEPIARPRSGRLRSLLMASYDSGS